jgi:hypothetical protein
MTFNTANLHLVPGASGDLIYKYDAGSDTMATVIADGYFNNVDDAINLTVDDRIYCDCVDGNLVLKVSAISVAGVVTTQFAGGNLPIQTAATGTEAALSAALGAGFMEFGTSIATATRYVLPTPYAGAEFMARRVDSGTQPMEFDAGGSGATTVVYDNTGNRRITSRYEGESFHVVGSAAARWRLYGANFRSSGSEDLGGGASVFIAGT